MFRASADDRGTVQAMSRELDDIQENCKMSFLFLCNVLLMAIRLQAMSHSVLAPDQSRLQYHRISILFCWGTYNLDYQHSNYILILRSHPHPRVSPSFHVPPFMITSSSAVANLQRPQETPIPASRLSWYRRRHQDKHG